jgi:transposase
VSFILTGGEVHDCRQALNLLKEKKAGAVLADKAYDSNQIVEAVFAIGAEVVIPPLSHRKSPRRYDSALYEERNLIERMYTNSSSFGELRLATTSLRPPISVLCWLQPFGFG